MNPELLELSQYDEDVNILVGINGSGKSRYLNELSKNYLNRGMNVIAIANTIYDKFDSKNKNLHLLKSARGKSVAKLALKEFGKILESENQKILFSLENTFRYMKLQPVITFKIIGFNRNYMEILSKTEVFDSYERQEIFYCMDRYKSFQSHEYDRPLRIEFGGRSFYSLTDAAFLKLLLFESKLKKLNILRSIEIGLIKDKSAFPITQASSGELTLLSTLVYISGHIKHGTVILIDEPENSLHPQWQMEYIKRLIDLYYFFQPKVVVATHSPLIINGAELSLKKVNIYKGNSFGEFEKQTKDLKNIEETYESYFDVTTPENRFLSNFIVSKLNLLYQNDLKPEAFNAIIDNQISKSYDQKQIEALREIKLLVSQK